MTRPSVSVIVPFKGNPADAERVAVQLRRLRMGEGDELLIVDNSPEPIVTATDPIQVVTADRIASSYYARNEGARAAGNDWLLFVDSDCLLPPTLIDDYFEDAPDPGCGILAGELVAAPGQTSFVSRYEESRGHLEVAQHMEMGPGPTGITANLMVRRSAWTELDGFCEVRSGADLEFCWRAQQAGWELVYRPEARVEHLHCETLRQLLRKANRYGPGQAWVNGRFPGSSPAPDTGRQLVRAVAGFLWWTLTGRLRRGAYKALDGLWALAFGIGYRAGDNSARIIARSEV